jgi:hypothetical protein
MSAFVVVPRVESLNAVDAQVSKLQLLLCIPHRLQMCDTSIGWAPSSAAVLYYFQGTFVGENCYEKKSGLTEYLVKSVLISLV